MNRLVAAFAALALVLAVASCYAAEQSATPVTTTTTSTTTSTTVAPTTTTSTVPPTTTSTTLAPTTTEAPPPTTTTPPVSASGSCAGWRDLVAAFFPASEVGTACRVLVCESKGDPNAVSPTNDHGLFQINRPTFDKPNNPDGWQHRTGKPWSAVYDPTTNVSFSAQIQSKYGWSAWRCY